MPEAKPKPAPKPTVRARDIREAYLAAGKDYDKATIALWNKIVKRKDFSDLVQELAFERLHELVQIQATTLNAANMKYAARGMIGTDTVPNNVGDTRNLGTVISDQLQKGEISQPRVSLKKLAISRGTAFRVSTIWNGKKKKGKKRMIVSEATGHDLIAAGSHLGSVAKGMGRRSFTLKQIARSMDDMNHSVEAEYPDTEKGNARLGALVPTDMDEFTIKRVDRDVNDALDEYEEA